MISVTILTKNSQKHIEQVLQSLKDFPEVVVYDTGSSDNTMEIASRFPNVALHEGPFIGFGPAHNSASNVASNDWVLSIDSDEVMSPKLAKEILGLQLEPGCVYAIRRDNYYNGKWIKWCGWYPERVVRLYHRKHAGFNSAQVHEAVEHPSGRQVFLKGSVAHYPYETTADFLHKMQTYSELFAKQNKGVRKSSLGKALFRSTFAFLKSFVLKKGFMGGYEGFVISVYNANTTFYKYLKLRELNAQER